MLCRPWWCTCRSCIFAKATRQSCANNQQQIFLSAIRNICDHESFFLKQQRHSSNHEWPVFTNITGFLFRNSAIIYTLLKQYWVFYPKCQCLIAHVTRRRYCRERKPDPTTKSVSYEPYSMEELGKQSRSYEDVAISKRVKLDRLFNPLEHECDHYEQFDLRLI